MFFDRQGVDMIAIGLRSGIAILKKAETLLSNKEEARIVPGNYQEAIPTHRKGTKDLDKSSTSQSVSYREHEDKVTHFGLLSNPTRLVIGSKSGFLTFYNLSAKNEEPVSFPIQAPNMTRII